MAERCSTEAMTPCFSKQKTAWLFHTNNLFEVGVKMTSKGS